MKAEKKLKIKILAIRGTEQGDVAVEQTNKLVNSIITEKKEYAEGKVDECVKKFKTQCKVDYTHRIIDEIVKKLTFD